MTMMSKIFVKLKLIYDDDYNDDDGDEDVKMNTMMIKYPGHNLH